MDIRPEQWYADTNFLTWLYSLFFRKYTRKPDRENEDRMREYLNELCLTPVNSWAELVDGLFVGRQWLK